MIRGFDRPRDELAQAQAGRRDGGDHGAPQPLFESRRIDRDALALGNVHLIQADDERHVHLEKLEREKEIALEDRGADDVDDDIGLIVGDIIARHQLFDRIGRQGIDAGQVDDVDVAAIEAEPALGPLDGLARPVAGNLPGAGELVEDDALADIGVAGQRDGQMPPAVRVSAAGSVAESAASPPACVRIWGGALRRASGHIRPQAPRPATFPRTPCRRSRLPGRGGIPGRQSPRGR